MNRKKIVHVLHSVGGVDVSLRFILENIDSNQFENIVIHGMDDIKKPFLDLNGNRIKEYKLTIYREVSILNDLKAIFNTIRILKKEKPSLVHAHSTKGGIIARTASLFYKTTVLHTPQAFSYLSTPKGFKRKIYKNIERLFKHFNSVLVPSSDSERNRGINEIGYKPGKVKLFNNSISPIVNLNSEYSNSLELPVNYIATIGRPSFQKNIEMMIEVIAVLKKNINNIHLVLMGVGEYSPNKNTVEELIKLHGLEKNVTMIKWVDRNSILNIVSKSKLYISTARYEGLPYSIIESLAMAKSCVVTNVDGNRDLIKDGYNGFLIEDFDVNTMADKIYELYSNERLRKTFEENSLISFNQFFNIKNNISKLQDIYIENF